jgi:hypothetical protein
MVPTTMMAVAVVILVMKDLLGRSLARCAKMWLNQKKSNNVNTCGSTLTTSAPPLTNAYHGLIQLFIQAVVIVLGEAHTSIAVMLMVILKLVFKVGQMMGGIRQKALVVEAMM